MARPRKTHAICTVTRGPKPQEFKIEILEDFTDENAARKAYTARSGLVSPEERMSLLLLPLDGKRNPLLPPGELYTVKYHEFCGVE